MTGEQCQHVVEKTDAGLNLWSSGPVQIQLKLDLGFGGLPTDGSCSTLHVNSGAGAALNLSVVEFEIGFSVLKSRKITASGCEVAESDISTSALQTLYRDGKGQSKWIHSASEFPRIRRNLQKPATAKKR
jgi:hypothetical protein